MTKYGNITNPEILDNSRSKGSYNFSQGAPVVLRIDKFSYLEEIQKGKIRMSTLSSFQRTDGDYSHGRGDMNEGEIAYLDAGELYFGSRKMADLNGIHISDYLNTLVFCMLHQVINCRNVNGNEGAVFNIDDKIITDFVTDETSEYGILLIDYNSFGKRCEEFFKDKEYDWCLTKVKYSDKPICLDGQTFTPIDIIINSIFRKREAYNHQNEVRLWVNKEVNPDDHPIFDIGDISDISRLFPLPKID